MTPRPVISRLRPIQSIAVTVIWRRSTAMGPCSPSLRVALLKRVLGSATAPTTSTRVRSSSSRKARRKLWLMDSPLLPNEDDTPGVASTEKPAYGLRGSSGRQRPICADRGGGAHVRVAKLYTPDSPTVTPARRGDVKTTQRAGCHKHRRTVDVDSLGVGELLLFGVHADVAAQEGVLGLHLRRSPSALRLSRHCRLCACLHVRHVRRHGDASAVGARRQHVHVGAHQDLHREQRRALCEASSISRSNAVRASRRDAPCAA
jgi:hypothetical protein